MTDRSAKSALRDYVGLPILLLYVSLLIMAAMVGPLRPAWLDVPHRIAKLALHTIGVVPGITLFRAEDSNYYVFRSWCIKARGESSSGERVDLYPIPMGCQKTGLRLRVSPVKLTLDHMLVQALHLRGPIEENEIDRDKIARRQAILTRLGEYFCTGAGVSRADLERVSVLWYAYLVDYRNGTEVHGSYVGFDFRCREAELSKELWRPDDAATVEFWGEEPWE